jgi:hypothetical protein
MDPDSVQFTVALHFAGNKTYGRMRLHTSGLFLVLFQPERLKERIIDPPGNSQSIITLVISNCIATARANISINRASIVSLIG